jgi:prophage tail gpP-like protein
MSDTNTTERALFHGTTEEQFKKSEEAILIIQHNRFDQWDSVFVEHRIAEGYSNFRFTATEREPIPTLWPKLQYRPGMDVLILLGGQVALPGFITSRQVAYDAKSHRVELIGKTSTWLPATSSINTATGNFDGMNIVQIAEKVLAPFPNPVRVVGQVDLEPFKSLAAQMGETIWPFLERIARVRGVIMGSDWMGNFLLIGNHTGPIIASHGLPYDPLFREPPPLGPPRIQQLTEGENILKMQCIISQEGVYRTLEVRGQAPAGGDRPAYRGASEIVGVATGEYLDRYRYRLTPAEQPLHANAEAKKRAEWERQWSDATFLEAHVTVQGWLRDGWNLWMAGDEVHVYSPMVILNEMLKIQTVTFRQDRSSGTTTTLHLRLPWGLNDRSETLSKGPGAYRAPPTQFPAPRSRATSTIEPPRDPDPHPSKEPSKPPPPPPPPPETGEEFGGEDDPAIGD